MERQASLNADCGKIIPRVYRATWRGQGWKVAFKVLGKNHSQYFADSHFVSPQSSEQAATQYAEKISVLCDEITSLHKRFNLREDKSSSGYVGVCLYAGPDGNSPIWIAYWTDEHSKRRQRTFSVKFHGFEQAKAMAIQAREKAMKDLRDRYDRLVEIFQSGEWKSDS